MGWGRNLSKHRSFLTPLKLSTKSAGFDRSKAPQLIANAMRTGREMYPHKEWILPVHQEEEVDQATGELIKPLGQGFLRSEAPFLDSPSCEIPCLIHRGAISAWSLDNSFGPFYNPTIFQDCIPQYTPTSLKSAHFPPDLIFMASRNTIPHLHGLLNFYL